MIILSIIVVYVWTCFHPFFMSWRSVLLHCGGGDVSTAQIMPALLRSTTEYS